MTSTANSQWREVIPNLKQVIIWGAGDQCRVNIPILKSLNIEVIAFIDESQNAASPIPNVPLFSNIYDLQKYFHAHDWNKVGSVIAIGNPFGNRRLECSRILKNLGILPISFADSTSIIRADAKIGEGFQMMPRSIINNNVTVGDNCIINTNSLVEHDCELDSGVEIGPGAILTGRVKVGLNSWIGAGAVVLPRLTIGDNTIVGAGAVVTKDIPSNVVVFGSPARVYRMN